MFKITYSRRLKMLFLVLLVDIVIIIMSGCAEKRTPCQEFLNERRDIMYNHPDNTASLDKVDQLIAMYCHCADEAPQDDNEIQFTSFQEDSIITIQRLQNKGWKYLVLGERVLQRNQYDESVEMYVMNNITLELQFVGKYRVIRMYYNTDRNSGVMVKLETEKAKMSVIDKLYKLLVSEEDID